MGSTETALTHSFSTASKGDHMSKIINKRESNTKTSSITLKRDGLLKWVDDQAKATGRTRAGYVRFLLRVCKENGLSVDTAYQQRV